MSLTDLFVVSSVPRNPRPVVYPKSLNRSADQIFGIQVYLKRLCGCRTGSTRKVSMGKGLFWTFFLFACATTNFGKSPDLPPPVPDEQQQIDRMFDLTNRLRAERK